MNMHGASTQNRNGIVQRIMQWNFAAIKIAIRTPITVVGHDAAVSDDYIDLSTAASH